MDAEKDVTLPEETTPVISLPDVVQRGHFHFKGFKRHRIRG